MRLSVVIPAHDEEGVIEATLRGLAAELRTAGVDHELLVVDDASRDATARLVERIAASEPAVRCLRNPGPHGFGHAVRHGLGAMTGDAVVLVMADGSDDPRDVIRYLRVLEDGYDCAFGSRFMPGATVRGYPRGRLVVNRIVNHGIRVLFGHRYDDTTNAFKAYRREVVDAVQPLASGHFELTVELPLKAIARGHSFAVVPTSWTGRAAGESKLRLADMALRYARGVVSAFLEHRGLPRLQRARR